MQTSFTLIAAILFLAAFTQSLSGFGVALIAMALLPTLIGMQMSIALVALVGFLVNLGVLIRYWRSLQIKTILPLIISSWVGVPLGILLLRRLDEALTLPLLGIIIAGYALYALLGLKLPALNGRGWAYGAGFFGGFFGGAYNTPGPPVILYASCQDWKRDVFKGNLQAFFIQVGVIVVIGHWASGSFTPEVWSLFWRALPWLIAGMLAGLSTDRWINPEIFRKIVLVLLVVTGLRLVF